MKCYQPVLMETRQEKDGQLDTVATFYLGCKLERGHEGHCSSWMEKT